MKRSDRQFARIYYRDFRRDYPDVYSDDALWAAWSRMLIASEEAWPALPDLPRWLRPKVLQALTSRGLVKVVGSNFVLKGWVAERTKRQQTASNAAAQRWQSERNANAYADADAGALLDRDRDRERDTDKQGVITLDRARANAVVDQR